MDTGEIVTRIEVMLEKENDHLRFLISQKILLNRKQYTDNKFIQEINKMIDVSTIFRNHLDVRLKQYRVYDEANGTKQSS